jgi:Sulfatase-modifying factor enzyme 1
VPVRRAEILLVLLATGCAGAAAGASALRAPVTGQASAPSASPPRELGPAAEEAARFTAEPSPSATESVDDRPAPRAFTLGPSQDLDCPADMVPIDGTPSDPEQGVKASDDGGYCIDRYEAPNERGAKPLAFQTAQDGEAWCHARGKELCTEAQWDRACEGTEHRRFPYGSAHVDGACNDDKHGIFVRWGVLATYPKPTAMAEAERLYQAEPSGSRDSCVSEEGVFDMTGNVAEWVTSSFSFSKYGHVIKGCYWSGCFGEKHPHCGFVNGVHPGSFRSYEVGFRCCKEQ